MKRNKITYKNQDESKSFDSYIKKLEDGLLDNIAKDNLNNKEEHQYKNKRSNNIKLHNHSNLSQRRLDKKESELESKESQLTQAQYELEVKNNFLLKKVELKDKEITQLKVENTQLILENTNLSNNNSLLRLKNEDIEKKIAELNLSINKQKPIITEVKSERYSIESSDEIIKDNKNMKKLIQYQKDRIKTLETELKNTIINSHKEKEGIYTKRIDALEKINKELLMKINSNNNSSNNQDYQQQFKDQLCLLLLKEKNDTQGNNNRIGNKKNKIFTFKNGESNCWNNSKKDKLERLIKEKDVLLSNGNYSNNDALILRIDEKINKILETINT